MNLCTDLDEYKYKKCGICYDVKGIELFKIDSVKKVRTATNICLECWTDRMRAQARNDYVHRVINRGGTLKRNNLAEKKVNKKVDCPKCGNTYSTKTYLKKHLLLCDKMLERKCNDIEIKLIEEKRKKTLKKARADVANSKNSCVKKYGHRAKIILY